MKKLVFIAFLSIFCIGCLFSRYEEPRCDAFIDIQKKAIYINDTSFYISLCGITYDFNEDSCRSFYIEQYNKSIIYLDSTINKDCYNDWNELRNNCQFIIIFLEIRDKRGKYHIQCGLETKINDLKQGPTMIKKIYE